MGSGLSSALRTSGYGFSPLFSLFVVCFATSLIEIFELQGDPTSCGYIRPDVQNVKSEAQEHGLEAEPSARGCCSEMKDEVKLLNQRIDSVVTEVWNLKVAFVGCVGVVIGVLVAYMLLK